MSEPNYSYNVVIDRFRVFAEGHYIIRKFTHGQIDLADIPLDGEYPFMHVVPGTAIEGNGLIQYSFDIIFADLARDKENKAEYQREVISDCFRYAFQLLSAIKNGDELFGQEISILSGASIDPFIEEYKNTLTGVTLSLTLEVPYDWNACEVPATYSVGGTSSGGSGTGGSGITLKVNGTNNAVQTLLNLVAGTGMTITDNGDGSVTFDATGGGGGGGVQSVTGLNTDNTDPENPIVRISVDGTTITGSGTPASPLVAAAASPQTLQNVLDTGSTLDKSNEIDAATFDFRFVNVGKLGFSSSGNQTFQRTAGGNSQALTLNGTVASLFYITGTSERGFAAGSGSAMIITTKIKNTTAVVRQPLLLTNATTGDVEFDSLTTADVNDSANRRYVTDAQQTVIGNTSGTNTGDETASTIKTKLGTTTVGENLNIATNPSAVTFIRINADNTVTFLSAAQMLTAIGAQAAGTYLVASNNLSDVVSAAAARTNLGATTIGANLFTATNPSAVTFIRVNADNTISFRTAAQTLSDIGAQAAGSYLVASNNLSDIVSAASARTNLGATTVGSNIFTLANPSAVRYLRINADNTVDALTASQMVSALGMKDSYVFGAGGVFNPQDNLTYFLGSSQSMAAAPSATAARRRAYVSSARTITEIDFQAFTTVAASGESVQVYLRVNNTTDTTLTTSMTWNAGANSYNLLRVTGLNIALAADDYWEIKIVCPTWATNPTGVTIQGSVTYQY